MYRWLKRMLAQFAKTTPEEVFRLNKTVRTWVSSSYKESLQLELKGPLKLPYFINCSMRARAWIGDIIYEIQKNRFVAFTYNDLLLLSDVIQRAHRDVTEAYLLEAVVHIQQQNGPLAIKSLKSFFELSMFELNDNMSHCAKTHRLAVPSQTPLMYAPILQARVCRMFGDFPTARLLLHESLQQSQLRSDEICHQLANVERHTLDILGNGAILEMKPQLIVEERNQLDKDRRILRKALRHIDDLHGHHRTGPCCMDSEDDFEVVAELDSIGKMLMLFKEITEGVYWLKYGRNAETGISCPVGTDSCDRGQKVSAFGHALMTSNMIRNSMWDHAKSTAIEFLGHNLESRDTCSYLTESHAVAGVNLAYSHAAVGNYQAAEKVIRSLKRTFPEKIAWQPYRHLYICSAVIRFEKFFLLGKYKEAKVAVSELASHSEIEYTLRHALLLSATGKSDEALGELTVLNSKTMDAFGLIRIRMQIATIHTSCGRYDRAALMLADAMEVAEVCHIESVCGMIVRRMATLLMCQGPDQYEEALGLLRDCSNDIDRYGTHIEKVCYYMTWAKIRRAMDHDPRQYLKMARSLCRGKWPSMEKMILVETAALHDPYGMMPDSNLFSKVAEQFGKLHMSSHGRCEWLLL